MADQLDYLISGFSTISLHADDYLCGADISSPIAVSTTFRHRDAGKHAGTQDHVYSRASTSVRDRVEAVLANLCDGYAITYASGLSAGFAAIIHCKPNRVAIRGGYHGTHGFLGVYKRHRDIDIIDLDDDFKEGDLVWIESPQNPSGEIFDIKKYTSRAHEAGAKVLVDSTFAPPPLQYPFRLGADFVMHSTTKYFSGHSDALGGLLVVKERTTAENLLFDRLHMGSVPGSLETWLLLRSVRTLKIRVQAQSTTATALAQWLNQAAGGREHDGIPAGTIHSVLHSSIQIVRDGWPKDVFETQMPGGHGATFSVLLETEQQARQIPLVFKLSQPATSLGGVESLTEWRREIDPVIDGRLVRVSIGLEDLEDLKEDWRQGLKTVSKLVAD